LSPSCFGAGDPQTILAMISLESIEGDFRMNRGTLIGLLLLVLLTALLIAGFRFMMSDKQPANLVTRVRSIGPQPSR